MTKLTLENEIKQYIKNVKDLEHVEKEIIGMLPEGLWKHYLDLKNRLPSDKSIIQKKIKENKSPIEVGDYSFKLSKRN